MQPYTKFRLQRDAWFVVLFAGAVVVMSATNLWLRAAALMVVIASTAGWVFAAEDWRYRDVREYLKREGVL